MNGNGNPLPLLYMPIEYLIATVPSLFARQPGKAVYVFSSLISLTVRLPVWLAYYLPTCFRPHSQWTYRQALMNQVLTAWHHFKTVTRVQSRNPNPDAENGRFVSIWPAQTDVYRGIAYDSSVKPDVVGGIWHPSPYTTDDDSKMLILHFHGSAFIGGKGGNSDCMFESSLLTSAFPSSKILILQYRFGTKNGGRHPAALQDAITAYLYLLERGIPAVQIVISGDAAGGNLVLALLRYISERNSGYLPSPAASLLWSPWINLRAAADSGYIAENRHAKTDFLTENFVHWGIETYISGPIRAGTKDPYVSPFGHPFICKTPIWIQVGGNEVLCDEGIQFAQDMQDVKGNIATVYVEPYANHDIFHHGALSGFEIEAKRCVEQARQFLQGLNLSIGGDCVM